MTLSRDRLAWLACAAVGTALLVLAVLSAGPADAQPTMSTRARARMRQLASALLIAARQLDAIVPAPGDASGDVRRWDRRWATALHRLDEDTRSRCVLGVARHDCRRPQLNAIACGAAAEILQARESVFAGTGWRMDASAAVERRLHVLDEARFREVVGLSCEDLPGEHDLSPDEARSASMWSDVAADTLGDYTLSLGPSELAGCFDDASRDRELRVALRRRDGDMPSVMTMVLDDRERDCVERRALEAVNRGAVSVTATWSAARFRVSGGLLARVVPRPAGISR